MTERYDYVEVVGVPDNPPPIKVDVATGIALLNCGFVIGLLGLSVYLLNKHPGRNESNRPSRRSSRK